MSRLEKLFQEALGQVGAIGAESQEVLRADLRLQVDYPNQFVAYIDRWDIHAGTRHLTRQVICHSRSLDEVVKATEAFSPDGGIHIRLVTDPNSALEI